MGVAEAIKKKQKEDYNKAVVIEELFKYSVNNLSEDYYDAFRVEKGSVEDTIEHWDIGMYKNSSLIKVEVKGIKKYFLDKNKLTPNDKTLCEKYITLEFINVYGAIGWLFGLSHYIAFEQRDIFYCIETKTILKYMLMLILKNEENANEYLNIFNNPEKRKELKNLLKKYLDLDSFDSNYIGHRLKHLYQRNDRKDIIIDVTLDELLNLNEHFIIKKDKNKEKELLEEYEKQKKQKEEEDEKRNKETLKRIFIEKIKNKNSNGDS